MFVPLVQSILRGNILHTTNRACAGRIAAASFTMHWADVSRGIFFTRFVYGRRFSACGKNRYGKGSQYQDERKEFHDVQVFHVMEMNTISDR